MNKPAPRRLRPWTALPQGFLRRPEVMRLSKEAKLLFWTMTDHSCEQLTDGVIQDVELPLLFAVTAADSSALMELATAGIVKRTGAGYQLTEHLEYTRSRVEREAAKAGARERKARQRGIPSVTRPVTRDITRPVTRSVSATEVALALESKSATETSLLDRPNVVTATRVPDMHDSASALEGQEKQPTPVPVSSDVESSKRASGNGSVLLRDLRASLRATQAASHVLDLPVAHCPKCGYIGTTGLHDGQRWCNYCKHPWTLAA